MNVPICRVSELLDTGTRSFSIGSGDWPLRGFVVRCGEQVAAYLNRCPHAGHPLNMRPHEFLSSDRTHIVCNSHGATFQLTTGQCVAGPCIGDALVRLPVTVRDGWVLFDGDPDEYAHRYA